MRLITVLLALIVTLMATPVQALEHYKFAIGTGFNVNNNKYESDVDDELSPVSSFDFNFGIKEQLKITDHLLIRTGAWLQEKSVKLDVKGLFNGDIEASTVYASVPVTLEYLFNDVFSIYGGYIADFRLNDYCNASGDFDDCTLLTESESVVHQATLGVTFNAGGLVAFDLNYQQPLSDMYKNEIKTSTVSAMIFFRLF